MGTPVSGFPLQTRLAFKTQPTQSPGTEIPELSTKGRRAKATFDVIVYHPSGLHQGIANRRAYETKTSLLQVLAHGVGFGRSRGNVFEPAPHTLQSLPSRELPEVSIEAAEFAPHSEERLRIRNRRRNFKLVSNDPRIGEQRAHFLG